MAGCAAIAVLGLGLGAMGAAPDVAAPEPTPSAEMLLYLAEFEDHQGHYIDPISVAEASPEAEVATRPEAGTTAAEKARQSKQRSDDRKPDPH